MAPINHAFREMALALPLATEQDHFGAPSFRVKGKIFSQLSADGTTGLVKLSPSMQEWALATYPDQCWSEPNWGHHGCTRLSWMSLPSEVVRDWLADSWRAVTPRSLHRLLVVGQQVEALAGLKGLGWEGDLTEMRKDRHPHKS